MAELHDRFLLHSCRWENLSEWRERIVGFRPGFSPGMTAFSGDLQAQILNVRYRSHTSHPSKLLRNLPLNGRNTQDLPLIRRLANDKVAAVSDVTILLL
jgi:hypothetical protein